MIKRSKVSGLLDTALDWFGLAGSAFILDMSISFYRTGDEPLAFPVVAGVGLLASLWVVVRRIVRWYRKPASPQP